MIAQLINRVACAAIHRECGLGRCFGTALSHDVAPQRIGGWLGRDIEISS